MFPAQSQISKLCYKPLKTICILLVVSYTYLTHCQIYNIRNKCNISVIGVYKSNSSYPYYLTHDKIDNNTMTCCGKFTMHLFYRWL